MKMQTVKGSAILVSHGQPSEPDVAETELALLRDRLCTLLPNWQISSATLAQPNALQNALRDVGVNPLVYPLFMTDGWFVQTVLPQRIGPSAVRVLPPLGADPALPALACMWLSKELDQKGWGARDTCLIVAAHGSGRSGNSARDTKIFADQIQAQLGFGDLRLGFIEEPPYLEDVVFHSGAQAICLPFFAAQRGHVLDDLPKALDQAEFPGVRLDPIGLHPDIPGMIADALIAANRRP